MKLIILINTEPVYRPHTYQELPKRDAKLVRRGGKDYIVAGSARTGGSYIVGGTDYAVGGADYIVAGTARTGDSHVVGGSFKRPHYELDDPDDPIIREDITGGSEANPSRLSEFFNDLEPTGGSFLDDIGHFVGNTVLPIVGNLGLKMLGAGVEGGQKPNPNMAVLLGMINRIEMNMGLKPYSESDHKKYLTLVNNSIKAKKHLLKGKRKAEKLQTRPYLVLMRLVNRQDKQD